MTRFRFRLQRVLRVRELEEEVARGEHLAALARAEAAQEALRSAERDRARAVAELASLQAERQPQVARILAGAGTLGGLAQAVAVCRERALRAEQDSAFAREVWQAARSAVRSLERLRDRRAAAHRAGELKLENAALDEHRPRAVAGAGADASGEDRGALAEPAAAAKHSSSERRRADEPGPLSAARRGPR